MTDNDKRWGATPDDWFFFSTILGLTSDLLPVVSNLDATISPLSGMQKIGKTPSRYNRDREVVGIADWTSKYATDAEIGRWSSEPDYGISVVARILKALDFDVLDRELADRARSFVAAWCRRNDIGAFPERYRSNSSKFLLAFYLPEETTKRVIRTQAGIIEFLGNRQQFIAAGTHDSGVRYEWTKRDNLFIVPELTLAQFDDLWSALEKGFGVEPSKTERKAKEVEADIDEPMFKALEEKGMVLSKGRNGEYNIICPFEHEHTTESAESATVYYPAHTGGYAYAAIKCLHAHCADRTPKNYLEGLGISDLDDFEDISEIEAQPDEEDRKPNRFALSWAKDFSEQGPPPKWLIKNIIPESSIGYIYGPPASGKTFLAFDMVAAVARGIPWNGYKTQQGCVVYVCAEGAYFFRNRIKAYLQANSLESLDIAVLDGNPDLLKKADIKDLAAACKSLGVKIAALVLDTYASCMSGDENSAQDVGQVIKACKFLQRELETVVMLIHHSGKDLSKGARGNSSLRAGVEFEFQVSKLGGLVAFENKKQKDGPGDVEHHFKLREIEIGVDDDLDVIKSCVIEKAEKETSDNDNKPKGARENAIVDGIGNWYAIHDDYPCRVDLIQFITEETTHRAADIGRTLDKMLEKEIVKYIEGAKIAY